MRTLCSATRLPYTSRLLVQDDTAAERITAIARTINTDRRYVRTAYLVPGTWYSAVEYSAVYTLLVIGDNESRPQYLQ